MTVDAARSSPISDGTFATFSLLGCSPRQAKRPRFPSGGCQRSEVNLKVATEQLTTQVLLSTRLVVLFFFTLWQSQTEQVTTENLKSTPIQQKLCTRQQPTSITT